jgi:hypothetical protein
MNNNHLEPHSWCVSCPGVKENKVDQCDWKILAGDYFPNLVFGSWLLQLRTVSIGYSL